MALFKISKGTAANLLTSDSSKYAREGSAWFTTDDGKFYIDIAGDGATTLAVIGANRIAINADTAEKVANYLSIDQALYDGSEPISVGNTIHYIVGNTTGTAGTWTGSSGQITHLYPGLTVAYKIGVAGKSAGTTLNINGTGDIAVKRNDGNLTTHVGVNSVIILTYDGTYWRWADYDSNTTNILNLAYASYKVKTVLYRYQFLLTVDEQYVVPVNAISNKPSDLTKTLTTEPFDPFGEVYYYNSSTTINAGTLTTTSAFYSQHSTADLRYSFNTGTTLTAGKSVYLVCVPQATGRMATLHSTPIVQDLPNSEDGLIYKYLGQAYDTYRIVLHQHKPCYQYKDGAVRIYAPPMADYVSNSLTVKLNNGSTEGTNLFTYDGSTSKTINITPASIGAVSTSGTAASASKWATSRDFTIKDADNTNAGTATAVDGSANVILHLPSTIKADLTGLASEASQVTESLTIKLNGGNTENTNLFTYNGASGKTINITASAIGALPSNGAAASADKWTTGRVFTISDHDSTNTGATVTVDGSANVDLKLPSTIKANLSGLASEASQVTNSLTIKLNGGSTENTDLFTYNGNNPKTINISPATIGALPSNSTANAAYKLETARSFTIKDADETNAGTSVNFDGTANVILKLPSTIKATLTGTATQVSNSLTIKINSGTTENTNLFTYNGASGKTINLTPSLLGAVAKTGDTMTGDLILATTATGDTPSLVFLRASETDTYDDLRLYDSGGKLIISHRSGSATWTDLFSFDISANTSTQNLIPSSNNTLSLGASDHKWNTVYATTFDGNATSADTLNNSLTIKLNGGTTENTNLFTFNGQNSKTVNITPSAIGALGSGEGAVSAAKWTTARNFTIASSDGTGESDPVSVDGSAGVKLLLPSTIKANLTGTASQASCVTESLTIKLNSGTTENTDLFTYNGSAGKTINITPAAIGAVALTGSTMTGNLLANSTANLGSAANPWHRLTLGGTTTATMTSSSTNPGIVFQEGTGTQPVYLIYTDYDNYRSPAGLKVVGGTSATPAWFEVEGKAYASEFVGPLNGNASTATQVNNSLTIKLNSGTTENTNLFTYNGSSSKTINITPSAIGALGASATATAATKLATARDFTIKDNDQTNTGNTVSFDGTGDVVLKLPATIKATLTGTATQVSESLTIKLNSGTTEGTNLFTYNGASSKTINITPSAIGALGASATAAAATKLATARTFVIKDADETNTGNSVNFDGTGNVTLKLPSTIKATLSGTATQVSQTLTIKINSGTTENTNMFSYNGGTSKTVDIQTSTVTIRRWA